tara:strand:+ start:827 stop:1249 length:423 start_codon:yes stop_codon:yes gene_type:complete
MQAYVAGIAICMCLEISSDNPDRRNNRKMIGVILWSDVRVRKAVVWCEDQGDLAFLCEDTPFEHLKGLSAGDLIEFDVKIDGNLRRVDKPILLKGYEAGDVAANLINSAHATSTPTGKILTFPSPKPINAVSGLPSERAM